MVGEPPGSGAAVPPDERPVGNPGRGPAQGPAEAAALSDSFKRFADVVPLMMWRSDQAGHAIHHNECWLEFTGRPLEAELGLGWRSGLHPEDFERHAKIVAGAFERRGAVTLALPRPRRGRRL